jgi:hypothetical protein
MDFVGHPFPDVQFLTYRLAARSWLSGIPQIVRTIRGG